MGECLERKWRARRGRHQRRVAKSISLRVEMANLKRMVTMMTMTMKRRWVMMKVMMMMMMAEDVLEEKRKTEVIPKRTLNNINYHQR
jgi:hypothetical protein